MHRVSHTTACLWLMVYRGVSSKTQTWRNGERDLPPSVGPPPWCQADSLHWKRLSWKKWGTDHPSEVPHAEKESKESALRRRSQWLDTLCLYHTVHLKIPPMIPQKGRQVTHHTEEATVFPLVANPLSVGDCLNSGPLLQNNTTQESTVFSLVASPFCPEESPETRP